MTNEGELSIDEIWLVGQYRSLTKEQKELLTDYLRHLKSTEHA